MKGTELFVKALQKEGIDYLFADLDYNVVYAQMGRGKTERAISFAYAAVAETVGRLAVDCCLYASQNFGFIHLPDNMTTGSSIMPHKKNPDVFELVRAHCNKIQGVSNDIRLIAGNLPSGYFRDLQILKEVFIPIFQELDDCCHAPSGHIRHCSQDRRIPEAW